MRALVIFLAMMVLATLPSVLADVCPSYDTVGTTVYFPHPYDCTLFVRCKAGQPAQGQCSPGQHFNPASSACDSPAQAHCTAKPNTCSTLTPESTCPYQCTCLRSNKQSVCPSKFDFGAELNVIDTTLEPNCERETDYFTLRGNKLGYLEVRNASAATSACDSSTTGQNVAHFGDCSKGVECQNGFEIPLACPGGFLFNTATGYCEDPQYINCSTSSGLPALTDCPRGAQISTCHHDCTCNVHQGACPAQLRYTTTINIYDARRQLACMKGSAIIDLGDQFFGTIEIHPNTTKVNHCPSSKQGATAFFQDPSNCQRAFKCENGKERMIICPNKLHHNPKTGKCGKPDPTVCQVINPPPPVPPTTLVPLTNLTCPSLVACPAGSRSRVAHLTDCTLFCQCTQGISTLGACPPRLHFNAQTQACDSPGNANCVTYCSSLSATHGTWSPQSCATGVSREGTDCRLTCASNFSLIGSDVINCTSSGWNGPGGLNIIPSCNSAQQVAVNIVNLVAKTLGQSPDSAMLFVLDESGSITTPNFDIEKNFVDAMVNAFPLSPQRPAGVITYSDPAATVDISLDEKSTCNFLNKLRAISYSGGGTNTANALNVAASQIRSHASNRKVLVFLISDGQSQTDPVAAANNLRNKDRILFTIGVAGYDRSQLEPISSTHTNGQKLFFGLPDFQVFKVVADYLKTTYSNGTTFYCP